MEEKKTVKVSQRCPLFFNEQHSVGNFEKYSCDFFKTESSFCHDC